MEEKINQLLFTLTYNQILEIENPNLRTILIKRYEEEEQKILTSFPGLEDRFDYQKSLEYNYYHLEKLYNESISEYLFPGDRVLYYPIIECVKARIKHTCAVTGAIIYPGSYYEHFRAYLYNFREGLSYVSKRIKYERLSFDAPRTLHEFEAFINRVKDSYSLNFEQEYSILTSIGDLSIQPIPRKRKKKA